MKSKRFSGLAKIWVWVLLMTCAAAFAGSGLQTENGEPPVLPPGKHFWARTGYRFGKPKLFFRDEE